MPLRIADLTSCLRNFEVPAFMPTPRRRSICLLFLRLAKQMFALFLYLPSAPDCCCRNHGVAAANSQDFGHVMYLLPHSSGLLEFLCIVRPQAAALRLLVGISRLWEALGKEYTGCVDLFFLYRLLNVKLLTFCLLTHIWVYLQIQSDRPTWTSTSTA